jgi:hypothetical protein
MWAICICVSETRKWCFECINNKKNPMIKHIYTPENEGQIMSPIPNDAPKENTFYGVMFSMLLVNNDMVCV